MQPESRYKILSCIQLANIVAVISYNPKLFNAMRTLFGWLHFQAKQEATEASLRKDGHPIGKWKGPKPSDLRPIIGGEVGVATHLRELHEVGLITFKNNKITVTETPLEGTDELLKILCGIDEEGEYVRSKTRKVPVFHEWMMEWAKPTRQKWKYLLHIFYVAACLSFKDTKSGKVKNGARFHLKDLLFLYQKSKSPIQRARSTLIEEGVIFPDETYRRWKILKQGHYVALNLSWKRVVHSDKNSDEVGCDKSEKSAEVGVPYSNSKQSSIVRDQTKHVGRFDKQKTEDPSTHIPKLDTKSWQTIDLTYLEYVRNGLIKNSQATRLFFHSAAVRISQDKNILHPLKNFEWMVLNYKTEFIKPFHEDIALKRIKYIDEHKTHDDELIEDEQAGFVEINELLRDDISPQEARKIFEDSMAKTA